MRERSKNTKKQTKRIPENKDDMEQTKKYKIKTKRKNTKLRKIIKITILVILLAIIVAAGIAAGKIYGIFKEAKLNMEDVVIKGENSIAKDIDGNICAVLSGDENRENISISEMSTYLPKAFVAIEDERFYEHQGVDIKRTGAATVTYVLNRGKSSFGGSTITQQLVKNLTSDKEDNWKRKVREMARAYYLEKELSKSQILELYLNLIFLGGRSFGVEVASNYYFSKSAKDLSLAESAFLAGINDGPNYYKPFSTDEKDIEKIKKRTKTVIEKMYELGKSNPQHKAAITEEEYKTAIAEVDNGLAFNKGTITQTIYSYHTDAAINQVKKDLKEKNGWTDEYTDYYVKSGGITIYTTQKTDIQQLMEEEVKKDKYIIYSKTQKDDDGNPKTAQTAMVLMDHKTGYVLATVGGIGEKTTAFGLNRATQSYRQPGSSAKPLAVLCPGIDNGIITAGSVYDDIPYYTGKLAGYKNYGYSYMGLTTVRYAIAQSKNIPMLKAINDIGTDKSAEFLRNVGITPISEGQINMTMALGSIEASPLQMAAAYSAIANDGVYIEPTFYTKVVDSNGNVILQKNQESRTVMSSATAYIIKEILTEVVRSGAGGYAAISGISVGVKTGTSNDDYDRWFCGFTPYYTAATWFGYDINEYVSYNGNPSGKIWDGVMEQIHVGLPKAKFSDTKPSNVTTARICKCSGKLATIFCENDPRGNQVYTENFIKGTAPTEECTCHVAIDVCLDTGLLAGNYCTNRQTKVFITRPDTETGDWTKATDAQYMLISDYCNVHLAPITPEKPEEPEKPEKPEEPEEPEEPENPTEPEDPKPNENTTGGNTTGNNTNENTVGGNNTIGNNTTTGNNTTGGGYIIENVTRRN